MSGYILMPLLALVTTLHVDVRPVPTESGSWLAWHGCWREVTDNGAGGQMLCVLPGDDASEARIVTFAEGVSGAITTLRVDGIARPVEDGGCTGTEVASWSKDGRRVFLRSELDCEGLRRVSTGIFAMVAEHEWVDIQAATMGEQHATRQLRYRAVGIGEAPEQVRPLLPVGRELARESARLHTSAPLGIEEVIEASALVAPPVLQGILAARRHGFSMDARSLVQLETAGVPREVIDVVVALSYPKRFVVQQPSPAGDVVAQTQRDYDDVECYDPMFRVYRYGRDCDRLGLSSRRYGSRYGYDPRYGYDSRYGYGYGYSPWGYNPYGWRYNTPTVIVIRPDDGEAPRQPGELVKGRGYTGGSSSSSPGAQPRSRPQESGSSSAGTPAGSSSGASSTSSGSGESSSSTGRTAVPRNGGGGG
jgi:hypothetical protein